MTDKTTEVRVAIPPKLTELQQVSVRLLAEVQGLEIVDHESYTMVVDYALRGRRVVKAIQELADPFVKLADQAHKDAVSLRRQALEPGQQVVALADRKALTWDTEQERLRQEAAAAAKREQERIAAEQAVLVAAEEARLLKEAEDRQITAAAEAEARGDVETAVRIMEAPVEVAPVVVSPLQVFTPPVTVPAAPKVAGYGFKAAPWVAVLENLDLVIRAAASGNTVAKSLLTFDQKRADKLADSQRNAGSPVPGVRFEEGKRTAWGKS